MWGEKSGLQCLGLGKEALWETVESCKAFPVSPLACYHKKGQKSAKKGQILS